MEERFPSCLARQGRGRGRRLPAFLYVLMRNGDVLSDGYLHCRSLGNCGE